MELFARAPCLLPFDSLALRLVSRLNHGSIETIFIALDLSTRYLRELHCAVWTVG
jgi:hypothetical protein